MTCITRIVEMVGSQVDECAGLMRAAMTAPVHDDTAAVHETEAGFAA